MPEDIERDAADVPRTEADVPRTEADDSTGPNAAPGDITRLLHAARAGDDSASERLVELAYDELRRLARQVRANRASETLNTTALLHEAYLKLAPSGVAKATDGLHFRRLMARAMRQVVVDAARRRAAVRHGGAHVRVTLNPQLHGQSELDPSAVIALDRALRDLRGFDRRRADVVECRFFGGLDVNETADALDISPATVKRDWRVARAWLAQTLSQSES